MARIRDVLDQALGLPVKQRARIAQELIASLDEDQAEDPASVAAAWDEEVTRRLDELRSGRAKAVPWSSVKTQINKRIQSVRTRKRSRSR